jgi:hypothetical protein
MEVRFKSAIKSSEFARVVDNVKSVIEGIKRLFGKDVHVYDDVVGEVVEGGITVTVGGTLEDLDKIVRIDIDFYRDPEFTDLDIVDVELEAYIDVFKLPPDLRKKLLTKLVNMMNIFEPDTTPVYEVVLKNNEKDKDELTIVLEVLGFK